MKKSDEEADFGSTAIPEREDLDETEVATTVTENAEPDDEPTGNDWVLKYKLGNTAEKEIHVSPGVSIAVLKEMIMKDAKRFKKDVKTHTFALGNVILGNNRQKVKTVLKDGQMISARPSITQAVPSRPKRTTKQRTKPSRSSCWRRRKRQSPKVPRSWQR